MKKLSALMFGLALALGVSASANQTAQAHLSKTFVFPVASLEKVEMAMQSAAARVGDAKKTQVSYVIDASENSSVLCLEDSPDIYQGHLYGCVLQFVVDLGGGAKITAGHMLYITQSAKEVNDLLSKTDPNNTARVDLRSPFDGGNGSAFYCNAEGPTGAKAWSCYLDLVD